MSARRRRGSREGNIARPRRCGCGFQEVAGQTNKSSKSLMRMPGPHGNPQVRNLFQIIGCLQKRESVQLKVQTVRFGLRANHSIPRPFERPTIAQDRGHTPPPLQIARSV